MPTTTTVQVVRASGRLAGRLRYVILVAVALGFAHLGYASSSHAPNDWVIFEVGARTLAHWRGMPIYDRPPLHLYADNPTIQIGPPALLLVVATQWLSIHAVNLMWVVLMTLMGVGALGLVEAAASHVGTLSRNWRRAVVVVMGVPFMAAWGYQSGRFHHLDDALALLCLALAVWLIASGRSAWLVGIALGLGIATKPWAVVAAPVLLGLPREARARAALGMILTGAAIWGPFVVAAPNTMHELGRLFIAPRKGSVLWLFGVHGQIQHWLRPVQFCAGAAAAAYVATRGRWAAAPLVGIAVRVALDPYSYGYYGLGPVLAALVWDLARPGNRRLPVWTAWTLLVEFGMRTFLSPGAQAVPRLLWVASVLGVFLFARRSASAPATEPVDLEPVVPAVAPA
jgi:hypothetical protein